MKVDSKIYKIFIVSTFFVLPIILLSGIFKATGNIASTWQAFSALCSRTWDLMIGYTIHYDNFWSLFVVMLFALALINSLVYLSRHLYKAHILKKNFMPNILLSKKEIHVIESKDLFAITAGFLKPQIYLSSSLFSSLSSDEIKAIIAHERYHQKHFHPFYLLLSYSINSLLFFLPVVKSFLNYVYLKYETLADDFSIEKTSKKSLSSALYKMIDQNSIKFPATVSGFSATKDRVDILTNNIKPSFRMPKFLSILSLAIVFFLTSFLLSPENSNVIAANTQNFVGLEENGYSALVPVDCYSPTQSLESLVKFGQQSEANMTYVPVN